jgi:hypothetical protein
MGVIQVSYDLNRPGKDYSSLTKHLKENYKSWCHPLDSYWFVASDKSAGTVRTECRTHLDANDELVCFDVSRSDWATLNVSKDVTDWFNQWIS